MKSFIHWWVRNTVAANFLMLLLLVGGGLAWLRLKKEIFPELSVNVVLINIPYPNAAPEEVEKGVVIPVEEAIQGLNGIKRITSTANESVGSVVVEVQDGFDTQRVLNDIKNRVDAIDNFAENAEKPLVSEIFIKNPVLSITVGAETDEKTLRSIGEKVRDGLLAYEGRKPRSAWDGVVIGASNVFLGEQQLSQVSLAGVRNYEISVEVSEATLRRYGLTFDRVAAAIGASSLDLPGGSVRTEAGEILIRAQNRKYRAPEFEEITVLTKPDGTVVKLKEIATVVDGFEENAVFTRFNGRPAILINVYRTGNEDTLRLAQLARDYVAESPAFLPKGVKLEMWNDQSLLLQGRLDFMIDNAFQGFVLVFLSLALILRPVLAFHVAMGIPIAFAGALIFLPSLDLSINMISLFAFIIVLGIVTDDAIVVGENVYDRMRKGEHPHTAAPRGTYEVMGIAIFGVITTMVAFMPMLFVQGVSGKIWRNIPWVVIPVLLVSLIETNCILPAHLSHLKPFDPTKRPGIAERIQLFILGLLDKFIANIYAPAIKVLVNWRYATMAFFFVILMAAVGIAAVTKFEFFPSVEADIISAKLTMPNGVPVETTRAAVDQMERAAEKIKAQYKDDLGHSLIKNILASTGSQPFQSGAFQNTPVGENVGEVTIELQPSGQRASIDSNAVIAMWRKLAGPIPGVQDLNFALQVEAGGNAIDMEISGPDLVQLDAAVEFIKAQLATYEGVTDIADTNREGKREIKLEMLPRGETLFQLGDVARQVRQAFYGEEVQRLQRGRDEVKVMVRYPEEQRRSQQSLADMKIRTLAGAEVPFAEVARVTEGRGYASIRRSDRTRAIRVTADKDRANPKVDINQVVADMKLKALPEMTKKFPGVHYSFEGEQKDQRDSMADLGLGFVFALFGIYVVLCLPLKSYLQPLLVMSVIPFGLVGVVVGHLVLGMQFSIMSMIGFVALAGVVLNESLVLVEFANRYRREGLGTVEAAQKAGIARFTAIMLTSVTSFIGLLPMITETSLQARFLIPCAISLAFGGLFNLVNTLVLVPCFYAVSEDIKRILYKKETLKQWEEDEQRDAQEELVMAKTEGSH